MVAEYVSLSCRGMRCRNRSGILLLALLSLVLSACTLEAPDARRTGLREILVAGSWSGYSGIFSRDRAQPIDFSSLGLVVYDKSRIRSMWSVPEPNVVEFSISGQDARRYRWFPDQRLLAYCHPASRQPFYIAPDSVSYSRVLQLAEEARVSECNSMSILVIAGAEIEELNDEAAANILVDLRGDIVKWQSISAARHLAGVAALDISCTAVTDSDLESLVGAVDLRELRISGTPVGDSGLRRLVSLANLKRVSIGNTLVTLDGISYFQSVRPDVEIDTTADTCD